MLFRSAPDPERRHVDSVGHCHLVACHSPLHCVIDKAVRMEPIRQIQEARTRMQQFPQPYKRDKGRSKKIVIEYCISEKNENFVVEM